MAIYEDINIEQQNNRTAQVQFKRVPTKIIFEGKELDKGKGDIIIYHGLRTPFGIIEEAGIARIIEDNLGFTTEDGTTGLQVLEYLGEFFEYLLKSQKEDDYGTTE